MAAVTAESLDRILIPRRSGGDRAAPTAISYGRERRWQPGRPPHARRPRWSSNVSCCFRRPGRAEHRAASCPM